VHVKTPCASIQNNELKLVGSITTVLQLLSTEACIYSRVRLTVYTN
jgi:hypothetical protein